MKKRLVIIPAFNEARVIGSVLKKLTKLDADFDVVVIDDGSKDETAKIAGNEEVAVLSHPVNRGLGGALGTGIAFAKKYGYDYAVTFDADGQHDPADLVKAFEVLEQGKADVIIGNRMHARQTMPWDRVLINHAANWFTFLLFGIVSHDSQSGFRGFNRRAIESITLKTDRMEVSSEIFGEIARLRLQYKEIPIHVRYSDYSRTKGQKNSNAWPMFARLIIRLFR